jgi:hypothetical protein
LRFETPKRESARRLGRRPSFCDLRILRSGRYAITPCRLRRGLVRMADGRPLWCAFRTQVGRRVRSEMCQKRTCSITSYARASIISRWRSRPQHQQRN